ncbi:MAG TPA: hypothetical protein VFM18_16535 [Methanosarcina sp.]|nr:hypothetical protein [Methanosarcina sp.]
MPLIQKIHKMRDFCVDSFFVTKKQYVMVRMANYGCQSYGSKGNYIGPLRHDNVGYVYHAEKVRPKFYYSNVYYKSGPKKGELKESKKIYTQEGGWKVRVYKFNLDQVQKLEQHKRHFTAILK